MSSCPKMKISKLEISCTCQGANLWHGCKLDVSGEGRSLFTILNNIELSYSEIRPLLSGSDMTLELKG